MDFQNITSAPTFTQLVAAFTAALREPKPTIVIPAGTPFAGASHTAPGPDLSKTTMKALLTRSVLTGGLQKAVAIYAGMSEGDRKKLQALAKTETGKPILTAFAEADADDLSIFSADADKIDNNLTLARGWLVDVDATPWVAN